MLFDLFCIELAMLVRRSIISQISILRIVLLSLAIIAIGWLCIRSSYIYNFDHILREKVVKNLYKARCPELKYNSALPKCEYDFVNSPETIASEEIEWRLMEFRREGITNGSYVPRDCNSAFSVAILVPFRNRQNQLDIFIPYMHATLKKQGIHYKIFVIEQQDDKPWNKGVLFNVGARVAMDEHFPCLILHDVDLLPLDTANIYACTYYPRHMSACIDKFNYGLPYLALVGGALAITSAQYSRLNGFSNKFEYWGGEDDDFARRIEQQSLEITRLAPEMSRYTMLRHTQEQKNPDRYKVLIATDGKQHEDGLNTVHYSSLSVHNRELYALLAVKL